MFFTGACESGKWNGGLIFSSWHEREAGKRFRQRKDLNAESAVRIGSDDRKRDTNDIRNIISTNYWIQWKEPQKSEQQNEDQEARRLGKILYRISNVEIVFFPFLNVNERQPYFF